MAIYPGLDGFPFSHILHWSLSSASLWTGQNSPSLLDTIPPSLSQVYVTLCLIPSVSITVHHLTQSASPLRSACPDHLNPLLLITRLTGSNSKPNNCLKFVLYFLLLNAVSHIHLIILIFISI